MHAPADLELKSISDIEEVDPTTTVDGTTTNVGMVFSLKEDKVPKKVNGLVLKASPKDELEEKFEWGAASAPQEMQWNYNSINNKLRGETKSKVSANFWFIQIVCTKNISKKPKPFLNFTNIDLHSVF